MDKKGRIANIISNMQLEKQVEVWNQYCEGVNDMDSYIYDNTPETVNEILTGKTPWELAEIFYGEVYTTLDDWVVFGIYGAESFSCESDGKYIFQTDIADYCVRNDEDFGIADIREVLDEEDA